MGSTVLDARTPAGLPARWPLGHTRRLRADTPGFLLESALQAGPVALIRFPRGSAYLVSEPAAIRRVLQDDYASFSKQTPIYRAMRELLRNGLLTSEGELWRRQRRLLQPAFHRTAIRSFEQTMRASAARFAKIWLDAARRTDGSVEMVTQLQALTMEIVAKTVLGLATVGDVEAVASALHVAQRYANRSVTTLLKLPAWVPTPRRIRVGRAVAELNRIVYAMIDAARPAEEPAVHVRAMLAAARDEDGRPMGREQIRDELLTLLLAGHDTTANLLVWTILLLTRSPAALERVCEEIDARDGDAEIRPDQLRFTRAVIEESLRLYPPAWSTARIAERDIELAGYAVPAGTLVIVSPWVTQRDPRYWPDATGFRPERWLDSPRHEPFRYFPFGGGPHGCIGDEFARFEALAVLVTVLHLAAPQLVDGQDIRPQALITLRPTPGVRVVWKPRRWRRQSRPSSRRSSAMNPRW